MKYKEFGKILQELNNVFYRDCIDMLICQGNKYVYIVFDETYKPKQWFVGKEYIKKYKEKHCNKK